MSDDDFLPTERPRLSLDELAGWLEQRFTAGEQHGPVVDDLRLYLSARIEQGWDHQRLTAQVTDWPGLTTRFVRNLLESLAGTGANPGRHDEVWDVDGRVVVKQSQPAARMAQRRDMFLREARMLARGGRLGDDTTAFEDVPEPDPQLDFGPSTAAWLGRSAGVQRHERRRRVVLWLLAALTLATGVVFLVRR